MGASVALKQLGKKASPGTKGLPEDMPLLKWQRVLFKYLHNACLKLGA